ncbi:MAG: ABC transporter ATP-binding protein [Mangrovibacterium sp.]|nr:ABC transporter ATP-binding protein [Mangrovibacterium sp.]
MKTMLSKFRFLLKYTHQFRWWYTGGIIFLWLTIWVSVTIPEFIQKSIDLIGQGPEGVEKEFREMVFMILGLSLVLILFRTLSRVLIFIPGRLIERRLKGEMFRKLSSFGKGYYDRNATGNIISRINNDIGGVRMITGFGILQAANILFALSLTPYKMWQLSPALTLYCLLPILVIFVIVRVGLVIMVRNTRHRMDTLQQLSGKTISFLSGNSVIKSYNIYRWAEERMQEENLSLFHFTLKIAWVRSFIIPLLAGLEQILKIVVLFAGGLFVIQGKLTIGGLTGYIAYTVLLTQPILGFGWLLAVFQQGFVGISSLQTIIDRNGADEGRKPLPAKEKELLFKKGVTLRNMRYTYPDGNRPVLQDISFTIQPGQVVGLTGKVGSGKTTLVNCINGYLRPDPGQLFFGDKDTARLRGEDIRSAVRTVSQDVFLFSDTIENNIAFGSARALQRNSLQEVIYKSALADELARFPGHEKTMVGEKGIMLSGGQKQRISLARALYTPCGLLILDDVFSAVDTETERFLIGQIFGKHRFKSLLVVSNRISVLEKTDFTLVLDEGRIVDMGTHDELLKKSDFYRNTAVLQRAPSTG